MRNKFSNRKGRIEKKFSTSAMHLLIKLLPKQYPPEAFSLDEGYLRGINFEEWQVTTVDYWGEADGYDAFYLLHNCLIQETTDWDGMAKADDEWIHRGNEIDKSPFFSPWRLGDVTRADIIRHCRSLVKAGVTWEAANAK